jgi:hypothetical protein
MCRDNWLEPAKFLARTYPSLRSSPLYLSGAIGLSIASLTAERSPRVILFNTLRAVGWTALSETSVCTGPIAGGPEPEPHSVTNFLFFSVTLGLGEILSQVAARAQSTLQLGSRTRVQPTRRRGAFVLHSLMQRAINLCVMDQ